MPPRLDLSRRRDLGELTAALVTGLRVPIRVTRTARATRLLSFDLRKEQPLDASGEELATVRERTVVVAVLRRLVGFLPDLGNVADFLPIPNDVERRDDTRPGGDVRRRRRQWRDVDDIDLTGDALQAR